MCYSREKTFCVDDRELMMFGCRWNDSNNEWFLGAWCKARAASMPLPLHFHASPKPMTNATIAMLDARCDDAMADVA